MSSKSSSKVTETAGRRLMNGKPVITVNAKSVVNFQSNFEHKKLCDGLTFSTGSACAYQCAFCYVPDLMRKNPHRLDPGIIHEEVVVRRANPIEVMRSQLLYRDGRRRFPDSGPVRVIYASPLVDVAANLELVRETIEACRTILELTPWHIRLLSKSNLLPKVDDGLAAYRQRIIYGVSTGTLDDPLAAAFEQGTPKVSKRLASLRELQDRGCRTFGMLCPSLPLEGDQAYDRFAQDCAREIRADRCEHIWAEVINLRGESFRRTCQSLRDAGFLRQAELLDLVSNDDGAWEAYARETFEAHARVYATQPGKLRFLQYVNKASRPYWEAKESAGAVLL
jgi:DNA repair photolyase